MYIDSAAIITIASVLGALTAIGAVAYKIIKWFQALYFVNSFATSFLFFSMPISVTLHQTILRMF